MESPVVNIVISGVTEQETTCDEQSSEQRMKGSVVRMVDSDVTEQVTTCDEQRMKGPVESIVDNGVTEQVSPQKASFCKKSVMPNCYCSSIFSAGRFSC